MIERFAPDATLPRQLLVEARIPSRPLADPAAEVTAQLHAMPDAHLHGKRIVIGVGSRGIDRIVDVVHAAVAFVRARGGDPIVIPAMGNHGGATDDGQAEILAGLGVTEETVGATIHPRMTTKQIGVTPSGVPVYVAAEALEADGVILVNRIKPHTDFESTIIQSGLLKMCAIGFGKSEGAAACHRAAIRLGLEKTLLEVSQAVLGSLKVMAGIALVEDGHHQLTRLEVMSAAAIATREGALLAEARKLMPALPFDRIDVLVIDNIGKDISGAGMDTNIIGRGIDGQPRASRRSDVGAIYVRGLTPASHGNAIGLGMADVCSKRVVDSLDPESMFTNALSAMTPTTAKIPLHFASDRDCLRAAIRFSGTEAGTAGIVRVQNTLALDRFIVSENYVPQIADRGDLSIVSEPTAWQFDGTGNFDTANDLLGSDSH
jgi:uncharacterized protein (DUF2237 family)